MMALVALGLVLLILVLLGTLPETQHKFVLEVFAVIPYVVQRLVEPGPAALATISDLMPTQLCVWGVHARCLNAVFQTVVQPLAMLGRPRNPTQHRFLVPQRRFLSATAWASLDMFAYRVSAVTAFAQLPHALPVKD